jgi:putative transposase
LNYKAIEKLSAHHAVSVLCRVLGVQRSGFYAWRRGPCAHVRHDRELTDTIRQIFVDSRCTYGAPRVRAELAFAHGQHVSRKRVARLMRTAGLVGCSPSGSPGGCVGQLRRRRPMSLPPRWSLVGAMRASTNLKP